MDGGATNRRSGSSRSDEAESHRAALRRSAANARDVAMLRFASAQERRWLRQPVEALRSEQRAGAALLAGGLAYRLFLWLLPFGLVIAAAASFWVRVYPRSLDEAARSFGLSGVAAHSAVTAIGEGSRARWYLLLVGVVLLLWAGIGAVRALRVAARLAWGLEASRMRRPLRTSVAFTLVGAAGLAGSLAASWARHHSTVWGLAATLADALFYTGLGLFALRHLPCPEGGRWRILWPGAVVIGVGLSAVQLFLAYFLAGRLERVPSLYGTLGAASVVLLVLFAIARLVVAAMFLNAAIWRLSAPPVEDGYAPERAVHRD